VVNWRRVFWLLLIATTASYLYGGSRWGLFYGVAGWILILLLASFGIRKRAYRSNFGTLEQWLQAHIYLGLLVVVILFFHAGGKFHDRVAVATLLLLAIVVISGIVGALLYATVPRLLTEVESNLTADQISEQLNDLTKQMARIAEPRSPAFQRVFDELARETQPPFLAGWRLISSRMTRPGATERRSQLIAAVSKDEQDELRQMLVLSRQHQELLRRLVVQQRYKNILEAWLYVHVPFTFALLIMSIVHITAVFYYGRIHW
jgi:predicted membrane channel-forming protein YqfA (hemolysin III family)